ncbi:MAG: SRPBCC family protein [Planctomycetota bacterium]|nr:SRPBCC family protein [Planctomycetota bacterium]
MFNKILLVLVVIIVALVVVVLLQPSQFTVTRKVTIAAPAEKVFAEVNDFHKWQAWSPWAKLDPKAKAEFAGPDAGEGAKFSWDGNDEVGAGIMTITESKPSDLILIRLDFERPMKCTNQTKFSFQPAENQTEVTWTMTGENGFVAKAVCLVMSMDQVVGGQFEEGLANLKKVSEGASEAPAEKTPEESTPKLPVEVGK